MNKTDVIISVSEISNVGIDDCKKVMLLSKCYSTNYHHQQGAVNALNKNYKLMEFFKNKLIALLICLLLSVSGFAQNNKITQTIRGVVVDQASGAPLPYISVIVLGQSSIGVSTNDNGQFALPNIPIGRHTIQASSIGYEPNIMHEILLTSAKEVYMEIPLKEVSLLLDEVVVRPRINKENAMNKMALSGARMLSTEEASRYAGGMDDPARLVSSFAGISSGVGSNGISIHGNAPSLLQWRLEDVEIPTPNHFADVTSLGGGLLSIVQFLNIY